MDRLEVVAAVVPGQGFSLEVLHRYAEVMRDYVGEAAVLHIGVATAEHAVQEAASDTLRVYPEDATRAQIVNQLVAEAQGQQVLLLDGPVLPLTEPAALRLGDADWTAFEGRRLLVPPHPEEAFTPASLEHADFNRDVHPESPIAVLVQRSAFLHVRGLDERGVRAEVLFMDLVHRLRRASTLREGRSDGEVLDLAVAVPGLRSKHWETGRKFREQQKDVVAADGSVYRNLVTWSVPKELRPVLVSVAIATRDRAAYVAGAIRSVLAQDFQEFELIIVDDGSTDETAAVVSSFADPRVRLIEQQPVGISHARNVAADASVGYFTAVHDDDDIMLPWRLSAGLAALDGDHDASYGSWVNFDDETAQLTLHLTPVGFGHDLIAHNGQTPGHATWLLPTRWVQRIRYDETMSSAIDHNLAIRTVLSGLRWKHTQKVHYLRRLHPSQVSQVDARRQLSGAVLSRFSATFSASFAGRKAMASDGKSLRYPQTIDRSRLFEDYGAYLPDHLVHRTARLNGLVGKKVLALDLHERFRLLGAEVDLDSGRAVAEVGGVADISWPDIVHIRQSGLPGIQYYSQLRDGGEHTVPSTDPRVWFHERLVRSVRQLAGSHPAGAVVVIEGDQPPASLDLDNRDDASPVVFARSLSTNWGDLMREGWTILGLRHVSDAVTMAGGLGRQSLGCHVIAARGADLLKASAAGGKVVQRAD
ncbi:glycosyltransferase family 2 protein [Serinicoccus marinus]|uniref:glycosyltransferase family 2 protein n=1 Tax=Serinicoccus marinus TaxID=247333 RepID=UPI00249332D0|nr:glycosyltransferase family 2 protein [Serinicoccus marinus]